MSKKSYPLFAVVLLGSLLVGCTDVLDRDFYDDGYKPSVVLEAKQFIESGKVRVSLLDMGRAYMSETEKNTKANAKADFSIDWGNYRVRTEGTADVVYVPIKLNKKKNQAFTMQTQDGRVKGFSHQFYSTLILVEGKNGKGFDAVMATYLYGGNMKEDDVKLMGRDFESASYTGYYITSNLDGTMLAGRYFEDGECKFRFRQNPVAPSERKAVTTKAIADADTIKKHDRQGVHLFLNVNPLKRVKMTRSSNYDMEWLMTHCSFCGEYWEDCTCVTIDDYPLCQYCHTDIVDGYCGHHCTLCDVCMIGFPTHSHYYGPEWGGGYNPPGGGSGTGGGGTYYGGDPDPEPEPEPNVPTNSNTFTAEYYLEAAQTAFNKVAADYPNSPACAEGVREMSRRLFNRVLDELIGNANTVYNNLENNSKENNRKWHKINYTQANFYASQGYFVIAAWNSGSDEMGHVDTILPGHTGDTWKDIYVMDTGWAPYFLDGQLCNARSVNQNINYSFGKKKRNGEEGSFGIYYYKE